MNMPYPGNNGALVMDEPDMEPWEMFLRTIQTEWDLINEKVDSITRTFSKSKVLKKKASNA
jgi:hypothetical protein